MEKPEQGKEVLCRVAAQELEHMLQACEVRVVYEFITNSRMNGKTWDDVIGLADPQEDYRLLMKLIEATVDAFPRNAWARCVRARALWVYEAYARAVADLEEALRYASHDETALALLGETYYLQADYPRAIELLGRAIMESPMHSRPYYARALCYRAQAEYTQDKAQQRILLTLTLMDLEMASIVSQRSTPYFDHILFETHQRLASL